MSKSPRSTESATPSPHRAGAAGVGDLGAESLSIGAAEAGNSASLQRPAPLDGVILPDAPHWAREHFIPVRKSELVEWLLEQLRGDLAQREEFEEVCHILDATLHFEYQRHLDDLKDTYAPFNPDIDTRPLHDPTPEELRVLMPKVFDQFCAMLERANYVRLSRDEIQAVVGAASDWGLRLNVDFEIFDRLDIYVRGDIVGKRVRRRWKTLYREELVDVPIYQRLVVIFHLSESCQAPEATDMRSVFVKLFKNVPKMDVDMLLPGARIRLTVLDRGKIALPTLSGLVMAVMKIVKGALIFSFLGVWGLIAFFSFVAGTIGYGMRSFFGYVQTKNKYQLRLTRSLYFQNLDNNAGVLYRLLDEAEEQEFREAVVGYYLLSKRRGSQGWTLEELNREAERLFRDELGIDLDFETHDSVAKLLRLGIAQQDSEGRLTALPADRALAQLERSWDNCFRYNHSAQKPWDRPD